MATKKATKKAAPKKVFEGKYTSKIVTRLEQRETDRFTEIKKMLGEKTDAGAVVEMIMNYKALAELNAKLQDQVNDLQEDLDWFTETIENYNDAHTRLTNLKIKKR